MSSTSTQLVVTADAHPLPTSGKSTEQSQYLTFSLRDEMFAIGILSIREIIEYGQLTEVPMAPAFIRGVINLRGAVVPVIDLAVRFGRPSAENTKRTCIVILEVDGGGEQPHSMGVVVDSVSEVLEISPTDVEPPPTFGSRIRNDFILGMGKVNGRFVVLLDVDRILSLEEVTVVSALKQAEARLVSP